MRAQLTQKYADFRKKSLFVGFVQVLPEGVAERLLPSAYSFFECFKTFAAMLRAERGSAAEIRALLSVNLSDAFFRGVFHNYTAFFVSGVAAFSGAGLSLRPVKWSITEYMPNTFPNM